jgi:hypothetical protein
MSNVLIRNSTNPEFDPLGVDLPFYLYYLLFIFFGLTIINTFAMERLFSPCTRLQDLLDDYPEGLQELNLDVSTEELLSAERAFTYADVYAMLGNGETTAWLTPHAAVAREYGDGDQSWRMHPHSYRFFFNTDDDNPIAALALSEEHLSEICDVILRLLAASAVHSVILRCNDDGVLISAPPYAYLMEQCKSLKAFIIE